LRGISTNPFARRSTRLRSAPIARPATPLARAVAAPAPIAVPARPLDLFATLALALAAVLPPIGFVALPELIGLIGPLPTAASLIGAVVLAPAAVGVVAALLGLGRVRARFGARGDKEHEYAICRVLGQTLLLAWALGLAALDPGSSAAAPCLLIAILAMVSGWSFLLHLILSPRPSAVRRIAAIVIDLALLSAFLHFGQGAAAIWYPAYLAIAFYAGFRFGFGALVTAAAGGVVGFGAVAATTPVWQAQPGLAAGLALMLAAMPGGVATLIRALARSREEADAASAAQTRFLSVIGQGLRGPVDAMARALPGAEAADAGLPAQALLQQISEVLDLAAIETGSFAPEIEPFDLHAVVNDTLALLHGAAAQRGLLLSLRLDPHVPYRLCGWPQQFAQIVNSLVIAVIGASEAGTIRIDVRAAGTIDAVVPLRISVRGHGGVADGAFDMAVVGRLAELMGGHVVADGPAAWAVSLPLALDEATMPVPLDLAQRPVLLVTDDSQFAGELAEPLGAWNADTRWVGGLDDALVYVERFETPLSPVLIVDGRVRVIPALSFVHRAALVRDEPPPILFVAEAAQIGALAGIGDGELTGLLPAPVSDRLLENALHALPTIPIQPMMAAVEPAAPAVAYAETDDRVTPIAAHPRYVAEPAASVDARVIAGLRNLSGSGNFFAEIVDSFRTDSRQIMDRIAAAADSGDLTAFTRAIHALRRCAATVGGTGLCELALSLRGITAAELRQQDAAIVQRLAAELARFNSALVEFLPRAG
jgi:two-component system sensor histidine kinase RpfC